MQILPKTKTKRKTSSGRSYWQSYSDMMAALLLVFILIMSSVLLHSTKLYDEKIEEQKNAQEEIDRQLALVEEKNKQLEEQSVIMEEQQKQLDKIIGVKAQIIEQLSDIFSNSNLTAAVDPTTGSIMLDASILYDLNKSELKENGKMFLNEFLPLYFSVLLSDEVIPYISEIIIEGHTDSSGTYMANLKLSQDRALSVSQYCIESYGKNVSPETLSEMEKMIEATGRSYNDLIYNEDGTENSDASRRVEFKFRLKDDEMISAMMDILNSNKE